MATATAMYHTRQESAAAGHAQQRGGASIPKGIKVRRLHKAFLRYHDPNNWPVLREALRRMGRADLIGNGRHQLVPAYQPAGTGGQARTAARAARRGHSAPSTPGCRTARVRQGAAARKRPEAALPQRWRRRSGAIYTIPPTL